jgi:alpha-amylase/alpha-mannosidase (GH57 family)
MKKLKVAFLWHQHQPYYKVDNEFVLPWVLLHGTKDYYDIPEVLYEFPNIKQTFNFAPSLNLQIEEYISGKTEDKIQKLTKILASELNFVDKREILNLFFHANYENMISIYPRYLELYNLSRNTEYAINNFQENDWLDLQVWYNLVWFGYYSNQTGIPKRLIAKGRDFTEVEKKSLQTQQNEILRRITYQYRKLKELGQIDLCCSPMFHPILPLLINSESAHEARPGQLMPEPLFRFRSDAELQLSTGLDYFKGIFGDYPNGVWPSEGSVSDDALDVLINQGIKWIATDEQILHNSINYEGYSQTEKFFPRLYKNNNGQISILFRDHFLSDRIGFVYSNWNEKDAALDFTSHLKNIRNEIIKNHGEDSLDSACVSVILDGENCWEYYKDNGIPFLRELFSELSNSNELTTVTCSEAANNLASSYLRPLNHIFAGSWINANFDIWIGHQEDIKAWNLLSKARNTLEEYRNKIGEDKYKKALEYLFISEGSDWFWWYGPEHQTINKPDFDKIFRHYIKKAYLEIGITVPFDVDLPIEEQLYNQVDKVPNQKLEKIFNFNQLYESGKTGKIKLLPGMSAMHQTGDFLDYLIYGNDDEYLTLKIQFINKIKEDFEIKFYFPSKYQEFYITNDNVRGIVDDILILRKNDSIVVGLPIKDFGNDEFLLLNFESRYKGSYLKYPKVDSYQLKIC